MGPCVTRWLLILSALGIGLFGYATSVEARQVSVCVADFSNATRFVSYDPLPDNLAFYLLGSPDVKVIERWRVRGDIGPSIGINQMTARARSMGADILVGGKISEESGKVVANVQAYDLARAVDDGFQVTIVDARDCRQAAAKAASLLQQHFMEGDSTPAVAESALPALGSSMSVPDTAGVAILEAERRQLAEKSMRVAKLARKKGQYSIRSDDAVTQEEFGKITARLARYFSSSFTEVYKITDPEAVVSRAEAVAALARGLSSAARISGITGASEPLLKGELAGLLQEYLPAAPGLPDNGSRPDKPTGLVVDGRGLGLERSMSPVIESEMGNQIYPDKKHLPSIEYVEEQGIISFVNDLMSAPRAGNKPLIIRAIGVRGTASQIAVISEEDAKFILDTADKNSFLKDWKVTFLLDPGY